MCTQMKPENLKMTSYRLIIVLDGVRLGGDCGLGGLGFQGTEGGWVHGGGGSGVTFELGGGRFRVGGQGILF